MARKSTQNNPVRQIVQTSEDQHKYDTSTFRRMEVNARPVNTMITPSQSAAAGLALSFAEANPELGRLMQTAFAAKNEEDYAQGQAARVKESGLNPEESKELGFFSSPAFQRGYMTMAGVEAGQKATEQMLVDWESDPQRNGMTTNEWIANWMKKNASGISDGAYTEGMMKTLTPTINSLVTTGAKEKIDDIRNAKNANITSILHNDFKVGWTPELMKQRKSEFQAAYGMSNKEYDDYLLSSVEQYINKGDDPEGAKRVLKSFYNPREDGTPGIAYKESVANSSKSIEKLMTAADAVAIQKANAQENADKIARTDAQRSLETEVLNLAIDKGAGAAFSKLNAARKADPNLVSPGFWDNLGTRIRHIGNVKKSDGEGGGGMGNTAYNQLYAKYMVDGGSVEELQNLILSGKITRAQSVELRNAAAGFGKMDNAVFKTTDFRNAMTTIEALPDKGILETQTDILKARKARARVEFINWVRDNPNAKDQFEAKAQAIYNTEYKFGKDAVIEQAGQKNYYPKYKNPIDAYNAIEVNKTEKDPYVLRNESDYWEWYTAEKPKAKAK